MRDRKRLEEADLSLPAQVIFSKPLGFLDYIKLQTSALCVISDSGTITEEASILGFPAVTIRNAHERPEGMDVGTLIMCGLAPADVLGAIRTVTCQHFEEQVHLPAPPDYAGTTVSAQVVRIILSYIGYVNHVVWRKP